MNPRVGGVAVLLLAVCLALFFFLKSPPPADPAGDPKPPSNPARLVEDEPPAPEPVRDLPTVEADYDFEDAPEAELRDLVNQLTPETPSENRRILSFDSIVSEGESLLTEGYEKEPGVFVFTSLTPRLERLDSGKDVVRISMKHFTADVSGNNETLSAPEVVAAPGSMVSVQVGTSESAYSLILQVNTEPDANGFRLRGVESETTPPEIAPDPDSLQDLNLVPAPAPPESRPGQ
ncbi:MAG: hypothetical protein HKN23_12035 [Verrucomicrobiales bacterium]|nr:hypothetical protein [Verrucomicrobiales bacterium]